MNSTQLTEEIKNSLLVDVDGVADAKMVKKGNYLRVIMESRATFKVKVTRLDDEEEDQEEDEDDEFDDLDDEDEEDEDEEDE